MNKVLVITWMLAFSCMPLLVRAQTTDSLKQNAEGEIESVQYEIVVDKENTVPAANRKFQRASKKPANVTRPVVDYQAQEVFHDAPGYNPKARPLRLKDQEGADKYNNYLKIGGGNYAGSYLDGFFSTTPGRERFLGARLLHRRFGKGPVDGKNSGFHENGIKVSGYTTGSNAALEAYAKYDHRSGYFYGYPASQPLSRASIEQTTHSFGAGLSIYNVRSGELDYNFSMDVAHLSDQYNARELVAGTGLTLDYDFRKDRHMTLAADYTFIQRKDGLLVDGSARHLLRLTPVFHFSPIEKLSLDIGGRLAYSNDSIDKQFHVYPHLKATYNVNQKVEVFAALTGNMDKVSLHSLRKLNFWLAPAVPIFHTNRSMEITGGFKAVVADKINVHGGMAFAMLKNQFFFQNDANTGHKFNTYYDRDKTKRTNLYLETVTQITPTVGFSARLDWFNYQTSVTEHIRAAEWSATAQISEANAPVHLPTYKAVAKLNINIGKKITGNVDIMALGGIKTIDYNSSDNLHLNLVDLKSILNLGVDLEYWVSKKFTVFVDLDNLTGLQYSRYLNYPSRGFSAMGGISWSF